MLKPLHAVNPHIPPRGKQTTPEDHYWTTKCPVFKSRGIGGLMKISKYLAFSAAATLVVAASAASASTVNVVTNGDFQTNTFNGWTTTCPTSSGSGAGTLGASDLFISSGSIYAVINSQNQATIDCDLYQDVVIPAGATAASLTMVYALTGSNLADETETRQIDVTTTAGLVLVNIQPVVSRTTTRAFAPLAAPLDLSAFAGQTIRLRARVSNTTINSGSANVIGLDDVVLNVTMPEPVPTLSEWAMMLLGLLMAGGAVLVLHRRQTLA